MACHFDFLVEYVSPNDDSIRAAGTFEMSQIPNDGLSVHSCLCGLIQLDLGPFAIIDATCPVAAGPNCPG